MKRTINPTGRKKIERENISINFIRQNGKVVAFSVSRLVINDLELPSDAKIYIEAYYRTELKRFDFGTVANMVRPSSLSLSDLAYPENLKFRILVVDPQTKKVLAHAIGITPEEPAERRSILPVEFKDLGNEIWRIEYEGEGGPPILCINNNIPNIENIAKLDYQFFIYVYPVVIREILTYMIFVDEIDSITEPLVDWHKNWLKFFENLGVKPPETLNRTDPNFDKETALDWINTCVSEFCRIYREKFEGYVQKLEENL